MKNPFTSTMDAIDYLITVMHDANYNMVSVKNQSI